jgi:glycosyltransferase involved in cell wall biosynthesis
MNATQTPIISAVVSSYNRYDLLPRAIESLQGQTLAADRFRIIVADNSPDTDQARRFGARYDSVGNLVYLTVDRPGLSHARNLATRQAATRYVSYMDDDAIADPRWLEKTLEAFESYGDKAAVVGGQVNPIWDGRRPPWLGDSLLKFLSVIDWGGELRVADADTWFAGTNVSYRTDLMLELGGFDESLGRIGPGANLLSNEETRLTSALRSKGYLAIYAPEAKVDHLVERSRLTQQWFRKRAAWQSISDFLAFTDRAVGAAQQQWDPIADFFATLPPRERSLRGLCLDTDDPELFRRQLDTIYMVTTALMLGFEHAKR